MPEPTFFTELDDTVPFGVAFIPAHHSIATEICLAPNPTLEPERLTKREKRTLGNVASRLGLTYTVQMRWDINRGRRQANARWDRKRFSRPSIYDEKGFRVRP